MPTYQYECEACGYNFDKWQSITEPKLKICPKCKKRKIIRLIGTGSSLVFKGQGFYETDYKKPQGSKDSACPLGKNDSCGASCPAKEAANKGSK